MSQFDAMFYDEGRIHVYDSMFGPMKAATRPIEPNSIPGKNERILACAVCLKGTEEGLDMYWLHNGEKTPLAKEDRKRLLPEAEKHLREEHK